MREVGQGGANPEEGDPRNCPQPDIAPFIADTGVSRRGQSFVTRSFN